MKQLKWLVCLGLLVSSSLVYAQNTTANMLAAKTWTSINDGMVGIGTHHSLSEGAKLTFNADGTWTASMPIFNATEGSWKLKSDKQMLLQFGSESKWTKALVTEVTENSLRFKVKRKTATYFYVWTAG